MPIPIILAVAAGVAGLGSGIRGGVKMKQAKDTLELAERMQKKAVENFEKNQEKSTKTMDKLGKTELEIVSSFSKFADCFEVIKNRPIFKNTNVDGVDIPKYDPEEIKQVSVGAGVLLGGLGGAALGTAGGFAAAGATTAAVMAFGTASTGTAISTLSGVAATNATLAAIGGGSLAAGGGGVAAGTAILGAATLGVGLLVGGVIFSFTGGHLSNKADEAYSQAEKTEKESKKICAYLRELTNYATMYQTSLDLVNAIYTKELTLLQELIYIKGVKNWNKFTAEQKTMTENLVLLVGLLNQMCKVKIVIQSEKQDGINKVNKNEVNNSIDNANKVLDKLYNAKSEPVIDPISKYAEIFNKFDSPKTFIQSEYKDFGNGELITEYSFGEYSKDEVSKVLEHICSLFCKIISDEQTSDAIVTETAKLMHRWIDSKLAYDFYNIVDSQIEAIVRMCLREATRTLKPSYNVESDY